MRRASARQYVVLASIGGLATASAGDCRHRPAIRETQQIASAQEIAAVLTAQNPNPVSVSPDGTRLLLKSLHPRDFELLVVDRATRRTIASHRQADTQLAPTWRPDGAMIAFLSDRGGDQQYRLHFLDLVTGAARELDAPVTTTTALRWSPSGSRLAYLIARRGSRARELAVIDPAGHTAPAVVADRVAQRAGFAWSPDGAQLATVLDGDAGAVTLIDVASGAQRQRSVYPDGEIRQVAWSPDGASLLVTARAAASEHFALVELGVDGGTPAILASPQGDVSGPLFLPRGDGVGYHLNQDGEIGVFVAHRTIAPHRRIGPARGNAVITGFTPDGARAWVLGTDRRSPPVLQEVPLDGGTAAIIHSARRDGRAVVEAERIDLVAADGVRVPAYLWRAIPSSLRPPGLLVRVHGGPDAQAFRVWDPMIQLAARAGVHVLSVNYRGSTGYGRDYEHAAGGHRVRIADILAAVDYAVRDLGLPRSRVVLFGHSYGALLVADAVAASQEPLGGAVLVSLAGSPDRLAAARSESESTPILAFHGDRDAAATPDQARDRIVGALHVSPRMAVFHDEGHTFHRLESWAVVGAASLALFEAPP